MHDCDMPYAVCD